MQRVRLRDLDVHTIDRGLGSPVLLLHGNPDSSSLWLPVIERLEGSYHCLAPDLPGFGRTPAPRDFDYSLENLAEFVEAFVVASGIEGPLSLVVHDIGGPFGLAWAVRHPERVRCIAVTNTLFHADYRWHAWARVWRTRVLGEVSMAVLHHGTLSREMRRGSRKLPAEYIDAVCEGFTPSVRRAVLRLYRELDPEKFGGWEESLLHVTRTVPTRVFWGAHDPYIPRRFADRFGTERVRIFPDCGHWIPLEESVALSEELHALFP